MQYPIVTFPVVAVALWSAAAFGAGEIPTHVKLVDPSQTVAQLLQDADCPDPQILTDSGKIYKVCALVVPPSVKALIKQFQQQ